MNFDQANISSGGAGHSGSGDHQTDARAAFPLSESGQRHDENHHTVASLASICDTLRELHRQRQDLHRAEKSLTLRIKAICRRLCGGDKIEAEKVYKSMLNDCNHSLAFFALSTSSAFVGARSVVEGHRKDVEKHMCKLVKDLPVYPWAKAVRGFGDLGLAMIVGEAGDLSNYSTKSKLWKRLGLAVIKGERQRRKAGTEALLHGYNPSRRSVVWTIGDALFRSGGIYAEVCRTRKEYERDRAKEQGLTVCPASKIPQKERDKYRSDGHIHNRAKRYMEKRLIRDLWQAWRRASGTDGPDDEPPPTATRKAQAAGGHEEHV